MATPYRTHDDVLARYPLKTFPALMIGLGVSFIAVVLMGLRLAPYWESAWAWGLIIAAALVPLLITARLPHYRVAGGKGELRVYRDRVEVPHPTRGEPIRFAMSDLRVDIRRTLVTVNGVPVSSGERLVLAGPLGARQLAHEVFASKEAIERALRDIRCVQQGLPIPTEGDEPPPRDKYDDQLDAELKDLDP